MVLKVPQTFQHPVDCLEKTVKITTYILSDKEFLISQVATLLYSKTFKDSYI